MAGTAAHGPQNSSSGDVKVAVDLDGLPSRHLDWPDCRNARDLGGLPTGDGRAIRHRALIRTDSPHRLTEQGVAAVHAYGVSRVIDLRRDVECERAPSPFAGTPLHCHVPVQNPADPDHEWLTLAEIYTAMLDLRPKLFATAVAAIADAPPGGVVVHCAGGKDRTGMVVAMALHLAGVETATIAADYALTEGRLAEENAATLAAISDPRVREIMRGLQPTPPEVMLTTLDHLDSRYGGVASYLERGGFGADRAQVLRDRLVG
ncbi:tyrosine-protein phosphatase [Actinopolymorpha sp. NPDC004070]|uniref:tyrosine-protein phosphatase n=1 Tax=Actinopolymorpha sp. NPDC004070 TaxID=3154548 RepID=UPI0033AC34B2